ncbi:unnamed protein product [Ceutorhynchus assimilis]|uniref:Sas10 C-terminal domain-containing protein n=1 Tax=Ceutorhynchus assimilis TaxID=467358 RepID=A0A9N9QKH1_9CUCU|nr:unnamed protein product [Ceutorhynchus assimilis]
MPSHARFDDLEEDYDSSDSEDERKLEKYKNSKQEDSDSEVEVLGVGSEGESSDIASDIALSDVEGQEDDDDIPDARAWGKEKKKYYGADYVDPDYGGFQGKDGHAAEIEEQETKTLQNQLMQQLDDNDFSLDVIFKKKPDKEEVKEQTEELIKTDLTKLTNKQKIQMLQKESPEFFSLVDDFKVKMAFAKDYLNPIIQKVKNGEIEHCKAVDCVQTHYKLILNYATNINMYLLLKGNNKLKNHPIIQRLYQYRQLLSQIEPVFEEIIKPQIELLLAKKEVEEKTLKLLSQLQNTKKTKSKSVSGRPSKKIKLDENLMTKKVTFESNSSGEDDKEVPEEIEGDNEETEPSKRAITYQIAKNKGLTPHRKKELRNPRVKHKLKFRKALIRRKGAVREPRKELSRYSGEISGIKASVSKSIKIKS